MILIKFYAINNNNNNNNNIIFLHELGRLTCSGIDALIIIIIIIIILIIIIIIISLVNPVA
jgi:hypothetical protein